MQTACLLVPVTWQGCGDAPGKEAMHPGATVPAEKAQGNDLVVPEGLTVESRILPPDGYRRTAAPAASFAHYLRRLPLKRHGSVVKLYDGRDKSAADVHVAVIDLPIGNKDLHQCADAVMRLRAEYLFAQNRFDEIHFNFTNGFRADYSEWRRGRRIAVKDNRAWWTDTGAPSDNYRDFWKYLEMVFSYAGTLSLSKEMSPVEPDELAAGDVFIQGGSPGHAVIIADVAVHDSTGQKISLLAQSYMPAQEIHILINPSDEALSPWYALPSGGILVTPEWTFGGEDLKRFWE